MGVRLSKSEELDWRRLNRQCVQVQIKVLVIARTVVTTGAVSHSWHRP